MQLSAPRLTIVRDDASSPCATVEQSRELSNGDGGSSANRVVDDASGHRSRCARFVVGLSTGKRASVRCGSSRGLP